MEDRSDGRSISASSLSSRAHSAASDTEAPAWEGGCARAGSVAVTRLLPRSDERFLLHRLSTSCGPGSMAT